MTLSFPYFFSVLQGVSNVSCRVDIANLCESSLTRQNNNQPYYPTVTPTQAIPGRPLSDKELPTTMRLARTDPKIIIIIKRATPTYLVLRFSHQEIHARVHKRSREPPIKDPLYSLLMDVLPIRHWPERTQLQRRDRVAQLRGVDLAQACELLFGGESGGDG
jgi:hypothetical protein